MDKIYKLMICAVSIICMNCGNANQDIKAGSICTIENGAGKFGIAKVLVINSLEAHIKIYKNTYAQRPREIDLNALNLDYQNDKSFHIGHVPLSRQGFDRWKPQVVAFEKVTKDELVGYEIWKSQE